MNECCIVGCDRPIKIKSRQLCYLHYQREWKAKKSHIPCKIKDCTRQEYSTGLCGAHYTRQYIHGNVQADTPVVANGYANQGLTLEEAFHLNYTIVATGCWLWKNSRHDSYGIFQYANTKRTAHRVSVELSGRTIPDGYVVDHLCMVKKCVNPEHLEVITLAENSRRGQRAYNFAPECAIADCLKGGICRGYCPTHYNAINRYKYPRNNQMLTASEKLAALMVLNVDGCIDWVGNVKHDGYPNTNAYGKRWYAYRLLWTLERGPIPDGMTVDHLCFNQLCMNLDHMEIVSNDENNLRRLYRKDVEGISA